MKDSTVHFAVQYSGREIFPSIYGRDPAVLARQEARCLALRERHARIFGRTDTLFVSSPGRSEIGGNHTDHNSGRVLAAAVTLDMLACVSAADDGIITLYSEGYDRPFVVNTADTDRASGEEGSSFALIRGVCRGMQDLGCRIGGFNAVMASDVLSGSGLSSSAAFEVLIATILDCLYGDGCLDPLKKAQLCQYAENAYFGKPSGLMDQCACSVGGLVGIDFSCAAAPQLSPVSYDFAEKGISLVVVNTGSSHDDLTDEYASIPAEMKQAARLFGCETLRSVKESDFYARLPSLRGQLTDRALLRCMHFFSENKRVDLELQALRQDDLPAFLSLVKQSGESSWRLLQNLYVPGKDSQSLALACALSRSLLGEDGAWRVHGGGFAGTVLAFVPDCALSSYVGYMEEVFGIGACTVLGIRPLGPVCMAL